MVFRYFEIILKSFIANWPITSYQLGMTSDKNKDLKVRWHDMGGKTADPIQLTEHDFELWEKRVDALMVLSSSKGYFTVDGLRRVLEDMGEEAYKEMTYYERWIASINQNLIESGAYNIQELGEKMTEVAKRGETYGDCSIEIVEQ